MKLIIPSTWAGCLMAVAALAAVAEVPHSVKLVTTFDAQQFLSPDAVFWPAPFWLWNAPLEPDRLRAQLHDMAAHGFRSVCMLPMPHAFRPDSTNNLLDPDYLTPEFLERARLAVDEASSLGMRWWLYDEGGWPSGQAVGKVTQGHPEFCQQTLVREQVPATTPLTVPDDALALVVEETRCVVRPGETWTPQAGETAYVYRVKRGGYTDLLNPQATRRFLELTHEAYRNVLEPHFGQTVHFAFTDEPNAPNLRPPDSITWTPNMDVLYRDRYGRDIAEILPLLFSPPGQHAAADVARARIDFYDLWTARFRDAYFLTIRDWCRQVGLASGGHLNGEDETLNAIRYGFGHALRQLRAMDVPGVDLIWRQLFPGQENPHFFPKYASSAAHQNGTRFAFTESFGVYGNGLTPAQAKWLIDYQYVRGINLAVIGCLPLTTQDHHMTGERPHFGPVDPLWDSEEGLWRYTARLSYLLSLGTPDVRVALYYPVRDMWGLGLEAAEAADTHDQLAQELLASQRDFDLIDDDLLADPATRIEGTQLVAGAMRYDTIVCGKVRWMHPDALARLRAFADAGGQVICWGHQPGTDGAAGDVRAAFPSPEAAMAAIPATVALMPASRAVRSVGRHVDGGKILVLFNEGAAPYGGELLVDAPFAYTCDMGLGRLLSLPIQQHRVPVQLGPGATGVYFLSQQARDADPARAASDQVLVLDDQLHARPWRRYVVGEHDFEIIAQDHPPVPFAEATSWRTWLTEDYSGQVDYTATVELPADWDGELLELQTGPIEYAAQVLLDGQPVGSLLWPPWRVELPSTTAGRHEITIRVANSLANELTSQRVVDAWKSKSGPGWPSPYHERALVFERQSRGGGIQGPVRLVVLKRS